LKRKPSKKTSGKESRPSIKRIIYGMSSAGKKPKQRKRSKVNSERMNLNFAFFFA
jgi:hypothetical protein